MLEGDDVKLIDMGGVRRLDDAKGDIYSTAGYSAPEAAEGPTPASDLFTVGRALAVLLADFRGLTNDFRYTLPPPSDIPVFAEQESLYRLLLKSTARNPDDRFESADEMAEQLLGVLREIVAVTTGQPRPAPSLVFGLDPLAVEAGNEMQAVQPDASYVPQSLIDTNDPGAQGVAAALAIPDLQHRLAALQMVRAQKPRSREARLRLASTYGELGSIAEANKLLAEMAADDPWEWRVQWLRGRLHLATRDFDQAQKEFDQVYFDLPGELAPKLALGFAAEGAGKLELARKLYDLVSHVDDHCVSAAFGLSRATFASSNRTEAARALARIPPSSSVYIRSRVQAAVVLVAPAKDLPNASDLTGAAAIIEGLSLDLFHRAELQSRVLRSALHLIASRRLPQSGDLRLFGWLLRERDLRLALERTLRSMAQLTTGLQRIDLVDEANQMRPVTWF